MNKNKLIGLFLEQKTKKDLLALKDMLHRDSSSKIKLKEFSPTLTTNTSSENNLSTSKGHFATSEGDLLKYGENIPVKQKETRQSPLILTPIDKIH